MWPLFGEDIPNKKGCDQKAIIHMCMCMVYKMMTRAIYKSTYSTCNFITTKHISETYLWVRCCCCFLL